MTAQVIFIGKYLPNEEEMKRREFIQEQLTLYHAELAFKMREFTRFQQVVFKEQSHNNVRKTWELIKTKGTPEDA